MVPETEIRRFRCQRFDFLSSFGGNNSNKKAVFCVWHGILIVKVGNFGFPDFLWRKNVEITCGKVDFFFFLSKL